jgi:hypothetical protein
MSEYKSPQFSRRTILKTAQYAPLALLPAPFRLLRAIVPDRMGKPLLAEFRFSQHYPAESPVDEMARLVLPGSDSFVTEKYAFDIQQTLDRWSVQLEKGLDFLDLLRDFCDVAINSSRLSSVSDNEIRNRYGITIVHRKFAAELRAARENFLQEMRSYLAPLLPLRTAEFQITSIREIHTLPLRVAADIRYVFAGNTPRRGLEQRIGSWRTEWVQANNEWHATQWIATDETVSRANAPLFRDVTTQAFGGVTSYRQQMLRGADHWRTILDGASGIDVYGNQGIAVGDFDNDGFDDVYICQPAGLPNRLYRNRGDGTFEDATERAGLDVLDACSCALFADFENRGSQDLLLVTSAGPLLFVNDGTGKFSRREDAFKFARPPQGTFTHAAVADYDHDGRLDVYFCLYNYYAGLDQYRYPSPYFDARNGPPNFLFRNQGGWNFTDRTAAAGMNVDNDRYSFACAWGDHNGDGWPDLYVANDISENKLYLNKSGAFVDAGRNAWVEEYRGSMGLAVGDFDRDGDDDLFISHWVAQGDALYQNLLSEQKGMSSELHFTDVAANMGVGQPSFQRIGWGTSFVDIDSDGWPDLVVANGSTFEHKGPAPRALEAMPSFLFWNAQGTFFDDLAPWNRSLSQPHVSRGLAVADYNNDGAMDIAIVNQSEGVRLLRNDIPQGNWD